MYTTFVKHNGIYIYIHIPRLRHLPHLTLSPTTIAGLIVPDMRHGVIERAPMHAATTLRHVSLLLRDTATIDPDHVTSAMTFFFWQCKGK